jgi:hypothetical protein
VQDQFAEGAQDQEGEESADGVGDDQGWACGVEPAAGAEEQAGADRAADGDHLDLPRLEALVVALVLGVKGCFRSMRLRRDCLVQSNLAIGVVVGHGVPFDPGWIDWLGGTGWGEWIPVQGRRGRLACRSENRPTGAV